MSIKIKINSAIFVILFVIGGLFFIGQSGCNILSGIRAYVGAEGLWAKAQKEATYQLVQYIFTENETRYQSFLDILKIPQGDSLARIEMERPNTSHTIVVNGFTEGGNHPEDIQTMILLYKRFKSNEKINKAIEQWRIGDSLISQLLNVGDEIHHHITNNGMSNELKNSSLVKIDTLQKQFNQAELFFSQNMMDAARWAGNVLLAIMLTFSILGGVICLVMLRMIYAIIADLEVQTNKEKIFRKKLVESEKKFRAIAETSPLAIYMSKGVTQAAIYINPTFTDLFGYTFDEVPTVTDWWPLAYPNETYRRIIMDEWQTRVEHAIDTKSAIRPMEVLVTCKDGTQKHISWGYITIGTENWAFGLDLTERKLAEEKREDLIAKLQTALSEIKTLRGRLPICCYCKNIRNDEGSFEQIESYIHQHSGVDFSHTICNSCMEKHHPEEHDFILNNKK